MVDPSRIARVTGDGWLIHRDRRVRAAIGHGGVRADKQEGDGATPLGILPLRRVFYRADRIAIPTTQLPREPITQTDGWCDDPTDRAYNRHVGLPYTARHEEFWRVDHIYDLVVVLGWNDAPVIARRGSAIFLHLARPDYAPTDGCIALSMPDLGWLLGEGVTAVEVVG